MRQFTRQRRPKKRTPEQAERAYRQMIAEREAKKRVKRFNIIITPFMMNMVARG